MKTYMHVFFVALSIAGNMNAITIKIENRLIDNLKISYPTTEGFVAQPVPLNKSITIESKSSAFWGPIKFTYYNVSYSLSYTSQGWNFQVVDLRTNKQLTSTELSTPYITLHDAELVGFVIAPYKGGAAIGLNTSISGKNLHYIDQQLERLQQSYHEIFPEHTATHNG